MQGLSMVVYDSLNDSYSSINQKLDFNAGANYGLIYSPNILSSSSSFQPVGGSLLVGQSMTFPSLNLNQTTTIDYSANGSKLTFTGASNALNGYTLSIYDWNSADSLIFAMGAASGISSTDLSAIHFYSDQGITQIGVGGLMGNSIVLVPEPTVIIVAMLLLLWLIFQPTTPKGEVVSKVRNQ